MWHFYNILFALIILRPEFTKAQDSIKCENFFAISFHAGNNVLRDELMSPLKYSGVSFAPSFAINFCGKKTIHSVELEYAYAKLTSANYKVLTGNYIVNERGSVNYFFSKKIIQSSKNTSYYLGTALTNTIDVRRHTSLFVFGEFVSSLNILGMFNRTFNFLHKELKFSYRAYLPFVNFMVTPNYAYSPPDDFFEQNSYYEKGKFKRFLNSGNINSVNYFFRFNNRIAIEKIIKHNNKLALYYDFDYYSYKFPQPVKKGKSSVGFSLITIF
jgi:hypothetical protein